MATAKKQKRFSDPDEQYLGPEPTFVSEYKTESDRKIRMISALNWYNHFCNRKDVLDDIYEYAKSVLLLKKDQLAAFKLAGTMHTPVTIGALIRMEGRGFVLTDSEKDRIKDAIMLNVQYGQFMKEPVKVADSAEPVKEFITPQQRLKTKIGATIMEDLRLLEDAWITGETFSIDAYERMKIHGLPAQASTPVISWVKSRIDEMQEAVDKSDPQCVEAFRHLSKKELTTRIKTLNKILDDLNRHKSNSKTVRKVRTKKPVAASKQVAKIQFLKESPEFKLVSVNPAMLIGAHRLFVFNVKTRTLSEYVSAGSSGLQVKGTSLQGWDESASRSKKLRKPEEILPLTLSKTARQIDNAWKKLTTKDTAPNGRLNSETILLRVLNA